MRLLYDVIVFCSILFAIYVVGLALWTTFRNDR